MSLRRLRAGELIALAGAICVVVSLALPWYENQEGKLNAWTTFGLAVALLILGACAALALVVATATERTTALPVAAGVWSTCLGIIATVAGLVRLLERPEHSSALCAGAWLAFAGALAILTGSWLSMRDERTELYQPPDVEPRKPAL
jgi:hypothetical protein